MGRGVFRSHFFARCRPPSFLTTRDGRAPPHAAARLPFEPFARRTARMVLRWWQVAPATARGYAASSTSPAATVTGGADARRRPRRTRLQRRLPAVLTGDAGVVARRRPPRGRRAGLSAVAGNRCGALAAAAAGAPCFVGGSQRQRQRRRQCGRRWRCHRRRHGFHPLPTAPNRRRRPQERRPAAAGARTVDGGSGAHPYGRAHGGGAVADADGGESSAPPDGRAVGGGSGAPPNGRDDGGGAAVDANGGGSGASFDGRAVCGGPGADPDGRASGGGAAAPSGMSRGSVFLL